MKYQLKQAFKLASALPRDYYLMGATLLLSALLLSFDLSLQLGIIAGVPYLLIVIAGYWFNWPGALLVLTGVATHLNWIGYFLSPSVSIDHSVVVTNRVLATLVIWVTAVFVFWVVRNQTAKGKP